MLWEDITEDFYWDYYQKGLFCFIVYWPWGFFKMVRVVHDNRLKDEDVFPFTWTAGVSVTHVPATLTMLYIKGCMNVI